MLGGGGGGKGVQICDPVKFADGDFAMGEDFLD